MVTRSLALVLALVAAAACNKPSARPPGAGSADTDENQAILARLQGYLDCLSEHSARMFQLADNYRARFATTPPTATSKVVIEAPPSPDKCIKGIEASNLAKANLPALDAAGAAFRKALVDAYQVTSAAHDAFDAADPKRYDPTKGAALHPQLLAAFRAFDVAQGALFDEVYKLNRQVHLDQLGRREARDGKTFSLTTERMMLEAEDLVRYTSLPADGLARLDTEALDAGIDAFENRLEELSGRAHAEPAETDSVPRFWSLLEDARTYAIAARQLTRRARTKLAYSDSEQLMIASSNEAGVVGTPAAMAKAYHRLLDDYNQR